MDARREAGVSLVGLAELTKPVLLEMLLAET